MGKPIKFHFLQSVQLANRTKLKLFIGDMFRREDRPLDSVDFIFCSDEYLLQINRDFLQHDYYTDIITFELAAPGDATVGEVYISVDRVKDNALTHSQPFSGELHRVVFHGVLHLCGYKDKSKADKTRMTSKENFYLKAYGM